MRKWLALPWRWLRRAGELQALRDENVRLRLKIAVIETQKKHLEQNLATTLGMLRNDIINKNGARRRK
jgi:hypothetical protein